MTAICMTILPGTRRRANQARCNGLENGPKAGANARVVGGGALALNLRPCLLAHRQACGVEGEFEHLFRRFMLLAQRCESCDPGVKLAPRLKAHFQRKQQFTGRILRQYV
jgi:hypothetical protein